MPNQRRKDKRNVTVTIDDELRIAIEKYAKLNGIDRTAAIKEMCRKILGVKEGKEERKAQGKPAGKQKAAHKKKPGK
jgi:hypothetical protein